MENDQTECNTLNKAEQLRRWRKRHISPQEQNYWSTFRPTLGDCKKNLIYAEILCPFFFFFSPKRKKTYKAINKSTNLGKHWPNLQSIKLIFKSGKIRFFFLVKLWRFLFVQVHSLKCTEEDCCLKAMTKSTRRKEKAALSSFSWKIFVFQMYVFFFVCILP